MSLGAEPLADSLLVAATMHRLRLVQADLADDDAATREQHVLGVIREALEQVLPQERKSFLEELLNRFPTWAPSLNGQAAASTAPASSSKRVSPSPICSASPSREFRRLHQQLVHDFAGDVREPVPRLSCESNPVLRSLSPKQAVRLPRLTHQNETMGTDGTRGANYFSP